MSLAGYSKIELVHTRLIQATSSTRIFSLARAFRGSVLYKRAVGFFTSGALIELSRKAFRV